MANVEQELDAFLTMEQTIDRLQTTRVTLYRWLRAGRIRGFKAGRQWRFREKDVEHFLTGTTPPRSPAVGAESLLSSLTEAATRFGVVVEQADTDDIGYATTLVIQTACASTASDIHIMTTELDDGPRATVQLRIDGRLRQIADFDPRLTAALIASFKQQFGMDVLNTSAPQDSGNFVDYNHERIRLSLTTIPTHFGEALTIRILRTGHVSLKIEDIGLTPATEAILRDAASQPNGLVIVSGPSGSGKTTTLYVALNHANTPDVKTITIEESIGLILPNAIQMQVNPNAGIDYPELIRAAYRSDPDVLMIGNILNSEIASCAVSAAIGGHLVFSQMHCSSAASALRRLLDLGVTPFHIADAVHLSMSQRLVRRLCDCARPAALDDIDLSFVSDVLAEHGLEPDTIEDNYREPVGCTACGNTGFRKRIAIYEALTLSPTIESALLHDASDDEIRKIAIDEGMESMALDGIRRAAGGRTTVRQVRLHCAR